MMKASHAWIDKAGLVTKNCQEPAALLFPALTYQSYQTCHGQRHDATLPWIVMQVQESSNYTWMKL